MSTPPTRATTALGNHRGSVTVVATLSSITLLALAALLPLVATPVTAQEPLDPSTITGLSMAADALLGAIVALLIGGGLVVLAPEFTERTTGRVLEDPVRAFLWGLPILVAAFGVAGLLLITIVGILLIVPLVVALVVLGTIGFLAAGRAVVDDRRQALFVAVVVAALANGVPYVGGLLGFVLGSAGVGAWYLDYRDDGSGPGDDAPEIDPVPGNTAGSTDPQGDTAVDPGDAWTAGFEDDSGPE